MEKIAWNILSISEVKRKGENQQILLCNTYYFGEEDQSVGGGGFLVNIKISQYLNSKHAISNIEIYFIIRLNSRYSLKFV